jgi:hypothetical protein
MALPLHKEPTMWFTASGSPNFNVSRILSNFGAISTGDLTVTGNVNASINANITGNAAITGNIAVTGTANVTADVNAGSKCQCHRNN